MVLCKLPQAGLGNQLFPLMKAHLFAHFNKLPVVVTGYHQLKIGPYLRREKTKRRYSNYFSFQKSILREQLDKWKTKETRFSNLIKEPSVNYIAENVSSLYQFSDIPHWSNYFNELKDHRELVSRLLFSIINDSIKEELNKLPTPIIGVHIRMGDFRKLAENEDFSKVGAVRTPEKYFIEIIKAIRQLHGSNLPVSVFTDGYRHEFEELFNLPAIKMVESNKDILDMLLLSRSKIIVTSAGSTFSYWSGFLSDAPIIRHRDHFHSTIRSTVTNQKLYEGTLEVNQVNELLRENILAIK
jgi:hypothetical protein